MLYKYYRYLLIIKIACLIAGAYILWIQQLQTPFHQWTTIMVYSWAVAIDPYQLVSIASKAPWPYVVLYAEDDRTTLHIPATYDTWYILQYLRNWFPYVATEYTDTTYFKKCTVTIAASGKDINVFPCQRFGLFWQIAWILLILVGVIL